MLSKLTQPHVISLIMFCSLGFVVAHFYATDRGRKHRARELFYGKTYDKPTKGVWGWFKRVISPITPKNIILTKNVLSRAGIKMSPEEFFATRVAAGAIGGGLFSLFFIPQFVMMAAFGVIGGYLFYLLPYTFATSKSVAVKRKAGKECHDYVDLLRIAVSEGADIVHAVEMVSIDYPGVLSNAFSNAISKTKGGQPLVESLKEMADWLDTKDVTLLVDSIIQSRQTGTPLVNVLNAQSERMRDALRAKATEQAQKAPVKMVFPLMLCILPSLMIIAIGPPMMKLKDIFNF